MPWVVALFCSITPGVAPAQVDVPPMDLSGAMLNREAMRVQLGAIAGPASGRQKMVNPGPHGRAAAGPVPALRTGYRADPAVTARVRRQFYDFVRRTAGPAGADEVQRAFVRTDPLQAWARSAAGDGMRVEDMGDALTEYWVLNWMMANGQTQTPPAKVRAVRAQMQRVLALSPAIVRLNDAGRQEMAEVFIYNALLQGDLYGTAVKTANRALQTRLGDAAEARMQNELHLDARRLSLTAAGFVARG